MQRINWKERKDKSQAKVKNKITLSEVLNSYILMGNYLFIQHSNNIKMTPMYPILTPKLPAESSLF